MKLELFMPLRGYLFQEHEKRLLEDHELAAYEKEISGIFVSDKGFSQLQDHHVFLRDFDGHSTIEKLQGMEMRVEIEDGRLEGVLCFSCSMALSYPEREELSRFAGRQFPKGYLESQIAETASGKMQVELWNPYTDQFWIAEGHKAALPKYRITDQVHPAYPKLRRIQALRDVNETVKKGELGGYVQREWNLSQNGECWLYGKAVCEDFARVQGNAGILDNARIHGEAFVNGNARVSGKASIGGDAYVEDAVVKGETEISGNAVAASYGAGIPVIDGKSRIRGEVHGGFRIENTSVSRGKKLVNPSQEMLTPGCGSRKKKQPER